MLHIQRHRHSWYAIGARHTKHCANVDAEVEELFSGAPIQQNLQECRIYCKSLQFKQTL